MGVRKRAYRAGTAALVAACLIACAEPGVSRNTADAEMGEEIDTVVARVDDTPIHLSDLARLAVGQNRVSDPDDFSPSSEGYVELRDEVISQRILARAARAQGLDTTEEAERRRRIAEDRMLGNLLVERHLETTVTESALRDLYEQQLVIRDPVPQVRASHMLLETQSDAIAARARVQAGEPFADVAANVSLDTATAADGGSLDWFTRNSFETAFTDAAFGTEPGNLSAPVKTGSGWHVILVHEARSDVPPTYDDLRDELEAFLTNDEIEALVTRLRAEAEIVRLPEDIGTSDGTSKP